MTIATPAATPAAKTPTPAPYSIPGIKAMLEGDSGTGKTFAITTMIEAGITPFILFTEPGVSTISKWLSEHPEIDPEKIHWAYVSMSSQSWGDMEAMARNINLMDIKGLANVRDANKGKYNQFLKVYQLCHNFIDDRTGESFGDISSWGADKCLFVDSLSGLATMSMNLTVGAKPMKAVADWGVAMDNLERFVVKLCTDLQCHMVLSAHLAMEKDEVTGAISLMAQSLGNKLSPKLPRYFDDVILCEKNGKEFTWSTAGRNVITKNRWSVLADKQTPSFVPLIEAWRKAGGVT